MCCRAQPLHQRPCHGAGDACPGPLRPYFLQHAKAGNVEGITSKGTDIQGTFEKEVTFEDSKPTTRFRTEIPRMVRVFGYGVVCFATAYAAFAFTGSVVLLAAGFVVACVGIGLVETAEHAGDLRT